MHRPHRMHLSSQIDSITIKTAKNATSAMRTMLATSVITRVIDSAISANTIVPIIETSKIVLLQHIQLPKIEYLTSEAAKCPTTRKIRLSTARPNTTHSAVAIPGI